MELQKQEDLIFRESRLVQQRTPLCTASEAQAVVIYPDSPAGRQAALQLQEEVKSLSGLMLPICPAPKSRWAMFQENPLAKYGSLPIPTVYQDQLQPVLGDMANKHLILLGNLSNNPYIASLYRAYLCPVDSEYPGSGGGIYLHSLLDPWGDGRNRIIVGASSEEDLSQAVTKMLSYLEKDPVGVGVGSGGGSGVGAGVEAGVEAGVYLPYLHHVEMGAAFLRKYPDYALAPDEEYGQRIRREANHAYATRAHTGMTKFLTQAALMYLLTGHRQYAQSYLDIFQDMVEAVAHWEKDAWGPWGFDADFQGAQMVQYWHAISGSPLFTDEDRLNIASHLVAYLGNSEEHWRMHRPKRPTRTRQNHFTFASLGLLFGALTFGCCYKYPEAERWLSMADECFLPQLEVLKGTEDCESYGWLTFTHALTYALVRPALFYFSSGTCRRLLERGINAMDNLGYQVPYGDTASYYGSFSEKAFWRPAAWLLADPALYEIIYKKDEAESRIRDRGQRFVAYRYDLPPAPAPAPASTSTSASAPTKAAPAKTSPAKLKVDSIDPAYYDTHPGGTIPIGAGFDKIAIRSGFDANEPYLLLDGIGNGSHGHRDTNAIVRFTSKNRIWLEDADYLKVAANFHNAVIVKKEGEAGILPPYSRLDAVLEGRRVVAAASTAVNVRDTDWTRTIMWVQGLGFMVVDRITALKAGDYDLSCYWRTVGCTQLIENFSAPTSSASTPTSSSWQITMGDEVLEVVSVPPEQGRWSCLEMSEPHARTNWLQYPWADSVVHVLRQTVTVSLDAGEDCVFVNFLVDKEQELEVGYIRPGLIRGKVKGKGFLLAINAGGSGYSSGYSSGSESGSGSGSGLGYGLDYGLGWGKAPLVYYDELDLLVLGKAGRASLIWEQDEGNLILTPAINTAVTPAATPATIPAATPSISSGSTAGIEAECRRLAEELARTLQPGTRADQWPPESMLPPESRLLTDSMLPTEPRALAPLPVAIPVDQHLQMGKIVAVASVDVDGDGVDEMVVGTDQGFLATYKHCNSHTDHENDDSPHDHGPDDSHIHDRYNLLWQAKTKAAVTAIGSGDVDEDGRREIIAGQAKGTVELFGADGTRRWTQEFLPHMGHPANVRLAFTGRLRPAAPPAVLIATESCHIHAYNHAGEELWRYEVVHAATAACAADIDGDGCDEVLAASEYWTWHCIKDGRALYKVHGIKSTGSWAVCSLLQPGAAAGGTGKRQRLALFGGWDGHLTAYNADREQVWDAPLGDIIAGLCSLPSAGRQGDEIGTGSGDGADHGNGVGCVAGNGEDMMAVCRNGEDVVAVCRDGYVYRYRYDGRQLWHRRLNKQLGAVKWLPSAQLLAVSAGEEIYWLSPAEGEVVGRTICSAPVVALQIRQMPDHEELLLLDAGGNLYLVDPR